MNVWITKYALTQGVFLKEVIDCGNGMVKTDGLANSYYHGEGRQWHRTKEQALIRAEAMRKAKIASLRKKIAKLEALRFE